MQSSINGSTPSPLAAVLGLMAEHDRQLEERNIAPGDEYNWLADLITGAARQNLDPWTVLAPDLMEQALRLSVVANGAGEMARAFLLTLSAVMAPRWPALSALVEAKGDAPGQDLPCGHALASLTTLDTANGPVFTCRECLAVETRVAGKLLARFIPPKLNEATAETLARLAIDLDRFLDWWNWANLVRDFWGENCAASISIEADEGYRVSEVHVFDAEGRELEPNFDLPEWGEWTEDYPKPESYAAYLQTHDDKGGLMHILDDDMEAPYPNETTTLPLDRPQTPTLDALLPRFVPILHPEVKA